MLRQPLQRMYGMQASDIDIYRNITREKTKTMVRMSEGKGGRICMVVTIGVLQIMLCFQAKYLALHTKKTDDQIMADFARPKYFNPYEAVGYGLIDRVSLDFPLMHESEWSLCGSREGFVGLNRSLFHAIKVLEPKDDKIIYKDWDDMRSEIGNLGVAPDDEQAMPTNVMYPGTSEYWRSDFDGY